ncbi:hypothetical protein LshimejAT787_1103790 [Lyophyllum shimeji]|uniref:Uncharacterized protein n=1 Tax=Lyophyllum shimeji TaxID=47721 RepID=A0A9P3PVK8_LYOSH|nr:hypothetical protein LshimejAT787_1103790 [Lyophyllum shimeji]
MTILAGPCQHNVAASTENRLPDPRRAMMKSSAVRRVPPNRDGRLRCSRRAAKDNTFYRHNGPHVVS